MGGHDPGDLLYDENTWWYAGLGITLLTFVIALFNFGPSIGIPESLNAERANYGLDLLNKAIWGVPATEHYPLGKPLPWTEGSWFWWYVWPLYVLILVVTWPFVFSDDFVKLLTRVTKSRGAATGASHGAPHLGENITADLVAHAIRDFVASIVKRGK